MATTHVELNGFQMSGVSPAGGRFKVLELSGWLTRTTRRSRDAKSQQDGDWPSAGNVSGRAITITGMATYADPEAAATERRVLASIGGRMSSRLIVTDSLGTLHAGVEIDAVTCDPLSELVFQWSIAAYATDPLILGADTFGSTTLAGVGAGTGLIYPLVYPLDYGVPPGVTPGAITLPNDGTATYWPRLRIDGPVPRPSVALIETGDTIRYNGTLTTGQWLDIDCGNRRVLLNGQVSVRNRTSSTGRWMAIPPGGGSVTWTADAADPSAELSAWGYQSAWQ